LTNLKNQVKITNAVKEILQEEGQQSDNKRLINKVIPFRVVGNGNIINLKKILLKNFMPYLCTPKSMKGV
jgi:hypothetical protein